MRACPHCAEQIQDQARVCRFCNRDVEPLAASATPHASAAPVAASKPGNGKLVWAVVGAVAGAVLIAVIGLAASRSDTPDTPNASVAQAGTPVHVPQTITKTMLDSAGLVIAAGRYFTLTFDTPVDGCRIKGHVETLTGGNRDVVTYVLNGDDLTNYSTTSTLPSNFGLFHSPAQTSTSFDVKLGAAGKYGVLISNGWSIMTDKVVTAKAVLHCTI